MVALAGPNGAGKSTLLRLLAGEMRPDSGAVLLAGRNVQDYPPRELALRRATLSQNVTVAFPFTVSEIVRLGAGDSSGARIDALVDQALHQAGLTDMHARILSTLSGGEQQRAHFARVMVQLACGEERFGPGLLLLDEPTSSLDMRHQLDLLSTVDSCARRGVAVVAILHDLNLACRFAHRIVLLDRGVVAADGPTADIVTEASIKRVFDVDNAVGRLPRQGVPFVLPQAAR